MPDELVYKVTIVSKLKDIDKRRYIAVSPQLEGMNVGDDLFLPIPVVSASIGNGLLYLELTRETYYELYAHALNSPMDN